MTDYPATGGNPADDEAADRPWFEGAPLPALLRAARSRYGSAIREALAAVGCDDVPRNGAFVIGGMARTGEPLAEIVKYLGASKQAVGQLVDVLVVRGYLDRSVDAEDRRRLTVSLTDRGRAAAAAIRGAVDDVEGYLVDRVGAEYVAHARATLAALAEDAGPRVLDDGE